MSYILDALRKAERDRNLGRTPSLGDVTTPSARSAAPARSLRPLLLLCLVVGLAILAVLVWPRQPTAPQAATVVQAPVASPAPAVAEPVPELPQARVPATVEQGEPALDESLAAESLDDLLEATPEPEPAVEQTEAPPLESTPEQAVLTQEETATSAVTPVEMPVPSVSTAPAPAAVRMLREMPVDYRAAFQAVRIDVHVYDADPAKRWALVNGRKVIEGVTLPEGPRVAEITPAGIVFDYRGEKSLFALNR